MKTIVLRKEIEPLPIRTTINDLDGYEGFLTSPFKAVAQSNLDKIDSESLFGIRQQLKTYQFKAVSETATLLKLAVFIVTLGLVLI